jgi:hypothetical protein
VWWFGSSLHFCGELVRRTSEPKPHEWSGFDVRYPPPRTSDSGYRAVDNTPLAAVTPASRGGGGYQQAGLKAGLIFLTARFRSPVKLDSVTDLFEKWHAQAVLAQPSIAKLAGAPDQSIERSGSVHDTMLTQEPCVDDLPFVSAPGLEVQKRRPLVLEIEIEFEGISTGRFAGGNGLVLQPMIPFADNMSSQVLLFHFWRAQNLSEPDEAPGGRAGLDVTVKAVSPRLPRRGEKGCRSSCSNKYGTETMLPPRKIRSTARPRVRPPPRRFPSPDHDTPILSISKGL